MRDVPVCTKNAGWTSTPPGADIVLTDAEMLRLMKGLTRGKSMIVEEDALILARWAQQMRMGNVVLEMVLDGQLVPTIQEGEVYVGLPGMAGRSEG